MNKELDDTLINQSMTEQFMDNKIIDKEVLYVNDSNNGSYNSKIDLETVSISNSGKWISYSEGLLVVPVIVSLQSTEDLTSGEINAFSCSLKSGHFHLIDSINCQMQNKNVIQQQQFSNFYVNYKVLSSWSVDDLHKYGPSTNTVLDDSVSYSYNSATGTSQLGSVGLKNNKPFHNPTGPVWYSSDQPRKQWNDGLRERLENTSFPSSGVANIPTLDSENQLQQIGKPYFTDDSGSGAARIYKWSVLATIRLCDLHSFFAQMPLVRGVNLRIDVVYNSSRIKFTGYSFNNFIQSNTTQLSGNTVLSLVSSADYRQPNERALNAGEITVEQNVVSTSNPSASMSSVMSSARLYVPAYVLAPSVEQNYLSLGTKRVIYDDIYMQPIKNVTANFSSILTNGILNCQKLVIIPFLSPSANALGIDQFKSGTDTAPSTLAPYAAISNLNVLVSGRTIFQQNLDYDFNVYLNELASSNSVLGGKETGISSGLLTEKMWRSAYSYYVVDISRRIDASDNIPLSVQIQGTVQSSAALDLYCFITYTREIEINLQDGSVMI